MDMTNDQLILKWKWAIEQNRHIFSWTGDLEAAYLAEQASHAHLAVESGVYMGFSSAVMLAASPELHLWCVDPFMVAGTLECSRFFLKKYTSQGRCEIIPDRCAHAAEMLAYLRGKIDLAFVDDGHAYDDVVYDIQHLTPLLRPGGVLCGHDYETPPNDVTRAVTDRLQGHRQPVPRMWEWRKP
jgi:predicted O-methyltransferase YrrM